MGSGLDDYWDRKIRGNDIPPEFGGPVEGVTGKAYEQLEFDFGEPEEPKPKDDWLLKNNVTNYILQAKGIIDIVMNDIGSQGFGVENHEFALWGASELLQNAVDLLE
jgi:hypothetical protein